MENKLKKIIKWLGERRETIECCLFLILMIIIENLAIIIAIVENNYLMLTIYTYVWTFIITECLVKKYLFEKIATKLLKKKYISNILFFITACITFALSWNYFIAFLFSIPQAILYGEYCKMKRKRRV